MRNVLPAALAALLMVGCGGAPPPAETFALENGLKVRLEPMAGTDEVALVVLYSVGGHHDPDGQSGLAHLLEHCYVTAATGETAARGIQAYVARYPKGWNAQTGDTYTVFATVFPKERLSEELSDAAARMGDLRITQADLDREVPRIRRELANMYGGMPQLAAQNLARERVRPTPRGGIKGGLADEVAAIHPADLRDHWSRYYKPINARLVIAGAAEAVAAAREEIAARFERIPSGEPTPPPAAAPQPVLPSTATVRVEARARGARPVASVGWATPLPGSRHYAASLVLVARLARAAPELATDPRQMPVLYRPLDDPGVLLVSANREPGAPGSVTIDRLDAFVQETLAPPMSDADVATTKNIFGFMLGLVDLPDRTLARNLYGAAFGLARRDQLGIDGQELARQIERVTEADLRAAAEAAFAPDRRAAVVVVPQGGGD